MKQTLKNTLALVAAFALVFTTMAFSVSAVTESDADISFRAPATPLALTEVPSFHFGEVEISPTDETYTVVTIDDAVKLYDLRGLATPAGWKLSVLLGAFETAPATPSLAGATLAVTTANLTNTALDTITTTPLVSLVAGDTAATGLYATAATGTGAGAWQGAPTNATLTILENTAVVATHSATLTWTLGDTP